MRNLLTIAALVAACTGASATETQFADFAVRLAHERGFKSCDAAVRQVFSSAGGEDMRVLTDTLPGIAADQLQMFAIWGRPGDTVQTEVMLRHRAGKCYAQITSSLVADGSCEAWLNSQTAFNVVKTFLGVGMAKNRGGVDAILRAVGSSCVITYRRGSVY